jgi:hypothetical protein
MVRELRGVAAAMKNIFEKGKKHIVWLYHRV